MLSFLPAIIIFPIHFCLQIINLACWAVIVISLGLIKLILPFAPLLQPLNRLMNRCEQCFGVLSIGLIKLFNPVKLDIQIDQQLSQQKWYLMISNHLSYLDIVLLIGISYGRIPAPKFFLKKELIWMPFVGLGAWALDMPFMQRYSQAFLAKNPHLRGKDIETTRKSCEKFKQMPTTVINFVEGTRFTPAKKQQRQSEFEQLLPPKAGGIAFTLAAMGELFTQILDVTLQYPDNADLPMIDMLSGRLHRVIIHIKVRPVDEHVIGDYFNNDSFKSSFQTWLNGIWREKDLHIKRLLGTS